MGKWGPLAAVRRISQALSSPSKPDDMPARLSKVERDDLGDVDRKTLLGGMSAAQIDAARAKAQEESDGDGDADDSSADDGARHDHVLEQARQTLAVANGAAPTGLGFSRDTLVRTLDAAPATARGAAPAAPDPETKSKKSQKNW